jgi:hypothetical protein
LSPPHTHCPRPPGPLRFTGQKGLPDVPLREIIKGNINRTPRGDKIKVIMGINECVERERKRHEERQMEKEREREKEQDRKRGMFGNINQCKRINEWYHVVI